ncbi:hypothetical protein [Bacillus inaquosorum]|nr:hypothetical protein [Bacillus inaquosorum]
MNRKSNSTSAATEVEQKLFHSVGIAGYEIKQQGSVKIKLII